MLTLINQLNSMNGGGNVSSTTQNLLALEGTPVHTNNSGTNPTSLGPFTTTKAALVVICSTANGTGGISSITGGGLTFASRATGPNIEVWTASAAAALSAVTFTINYFAGVSFVTLDVFAISGNNTGTIYDGNASIPATSTTDPITVSTSNANDFIYGTFRGSTASMTQGAGWTLISGADFQMVEYKIVSVTQSNLSVSIGTGVGTANGGIADAVMSA